MAAALTMAAPPAVESEPEPVLPQETEELITAGNRPLTVSTVPELQEPGLPLAPATGMQPLQPVAPQAADPSAAASEVASQATIVPQPLLPAPPLEVAPLNTHPAPGTEPLQRQATIVDAAMHYSEEATLRRDPVEDELHQLALRLSPDYPPAPGRSDSRGAVFQPAAPPPAPEPPSLTASGRHEAVRTLDPTFLGESPSAVALEEPPAQLAQNGQLEIAAEAAPDTRFDTATGPAFIEPAAEPALLAPAVADPAPIAWGSTAEEGEETDHLGHSTLRIPVESIQALVRNYQGVESGGLTEQGSVAPFEVRERAGVVAPLLNETTAIELEPETAPDGSPQAEPEAVAWSQPELAAEEPPAADTADPSSHQRAAVAAEPDADRPEGRGVPEAATNTAPAAIPAVQGVVLEDASPQDDLPTEEILVPRVPLPDERPGTEPPPVESAPASPMADPEVAPAHQPGLRAEAEISLEARPRSSAPPEDSGRFEVELKGGPQAATEPGPVAETRTQLTAEPGEPEPVAEAPAEAPVSAAQSWDAELVPEASEPLPGQDEPSALAAPLAAESVSEPAIGQPRHSPEIAVDSGLPQSEILIAEERIVLVPEEQPGTLADALSLSLETSSEPVATESVFDDSLDPDWRPSHPALLDSAAELTATTQLRIPVPVPPPEAVSSGEARGAEWLGDGGPEVTPIEEPPASQPQEVEALPAAASPAANLPAGEIPSMDPLPYHRANDIDPIVAYQFGVTPREEAPYDPFGYRTFPQPPAAAPVPTGYAADTPGPYHPLPAGEPPATLAPFVSTAASTRRRLAPIPAGHEIQGENPEPSFSLPGPMLPPQLDRFLEGTILAGSGKQSKRKAREAKSGTPGWMITFLVAMIVLTAGIGVLKNTMTPSAEATPVPAKQAAGPAAQQVSHPLSKYLEVTGVRVVLDFNRKSQVQYIVVNHSAAEIADITLHVTVRGEGRTQPICAFSFRLPSLGPFESKELSMPIEKPARGVELPEWQNLRTEFQITAN
jgi:hypothetical protein